MRSVFPELDEVITLPSGTELSIEAAIGDLYRTMEVLDDHGLVGGEMADLEHIVELLQSFAK